MKGGWNPRWTKKELKTLRSIFPKGNKSEIIQLFPSRTYEGVRTKASVLGLQRNRATRGDAFHCKYLSSIDKTVLAYLAGFFDGEGTVFVYMKPPRAGIQGKSVRFGVQASAVNTCKQSIDYFQKFFKGGCKIRSADKRRNFNKPLYGWHIGGKKAQQFLELVLPYLIVKKRQAELAIKLQCRIKYQPHLSEKEIKARSEIFYAIRKLNGRTYQSSPLPFRPKSKS